VSAEATAQRLANEMIKSTLDASEITREMADRFPSNVYVNSDLDTTVDPDATFAYQTSIVELPAELQSHAHDLLTKLAREVPRRSQKDVTDETRLEMQHRAPTQEEILDRFHRWTYSAKLLTRPLLLFNSTAPSPKDRKLMQDRLNALLNGISYVSAEDILMKLQVSPPQGSIVGEMGKRMNDLFDIVTVDMERIRPTDAQVASAPSDYRFITWAGRELYGQAMVCTVVDKEETQLIAYFWIPPISLSRHAPD
jgi:hypothetical protein